MEQILTLEDVCTLLKISVQTGRNRLCGGAPMPPSFRTGRRRLFLASAVNAWILQQAGVTPIDGHDDIPTTRPVGNTTAVQERPLTRKTPLQGRGEFTSLALSSRVA